MSANKLIKASTHSTRLSTTLVWNSVRSKKYHATAASTATTADSPYTISRLPRCGSEHVGFSSGSASKLPRDSSRYL